MESPYIPRDLSWLSFNYRVLQEAKDHNVPLLERLKFLAIYSSNLDEFFRVRVASVRSLLRAGKKARREADFDPEELHHNILVEVNRQMMEYADIFTHRLIPALREAGIALLQAEQLNPHQQTFVQRYFQDHVSRYVQPVLLNKQKIRPFLINGALYLAVTLTPKGKASSEKYALLRIPSSDTARFVILPPAEAGQHDVIYLDDIVRFLLPSLFPGYDVKASHSFKLTRDAELNIDDEYSGDLIAKIRAGLAKRNSGPSTRFIYDREMPKKKLKLLCSIFNIPAEDLIPEGRYHNNVDLMKFPDCGLPNLRDASLPPLTHPSFENKESIFDIIDKGDQLLHFPYQKYDYVAQLFEQAADDPMVTAIRLTQYRVAKRSCIMDALQRAVKNGKKVIVFVEIKARFDEENNLQWASALERCGARVLYSLPGLKVHAKLALITRESPDKKIKHYSYFSTGNFNENTSKIYTDYGLMTADERLTKDMQRVFTFLETGIEPTQEFQHILSGRFVLYPRIMEWIDKEIAIAKEGKEAEIKIKVNSLEETSIIEKLYEASAAGVKVTLLIRGICCLRPNEAGLSDNIEARSVIDRFLEHSRIFWFKNNGEDILYLSSADLMARNLHHRIECAFPIYDAKLKAEVINNFTLQLSDNVKSRLLDVAQLNMYYREGSTPIRSQMALYDYYQTKANTKL